ncbi:MAG: hypothetical protein LBD82_00910 [Deltaproteobacteria bacterium]|jgi:hypothetical protein|nr:hypothetical protein [Deltaproteobacteria bacterium]
MITEKINGCVMAINALAGQVPDDAWQSLKCIRAELVDAADMTQAVEERVTVEQLCQAVEAHRQAKGAAAHG